MYQIEKGIPIPERKPLNEGRSPLRLALEQLEIGDSLVVDRKMEASPHPMAKQAGIKVTMRRQSDGTTRVWRVA
jgi:hypothetical protein